MELTCYLITLLNTFYCLIQMTDYLQDIRKKMVLY